MKNIIFLFSFLIKEPPNNGKWKHFAYKAACISQYLTAFFTFISLVQAIHLTKSNGVFDPQFITAIIWYFAPFIFYFTIVYFAPIVFAIIVCMMLFHIFC